LLLTDGRAPSRKCGWSRNPMSSSGEVDNNCSTSEKVLFFYVQPIARK
jgi:hypothetical protein